MTKDIKQSISTDTNEFANITIRVDADCFLLCDGEYSEIELQANKLTKLKMPIGQHLLEFVDKTDSDIKMEKVVDWPNAGRSYLLLVTGLADTITSGKPEESLQYQNTEQTSVAKSSNKSKKTFTINGVSFNMIYVEHGSFMMGATEEEAAILDSYADYARPRHRVKISKDYYIGETSVTQALWKAVMGSNPSEFRGDNHPVEYVSWDDCQNFILKLSAITKVNFRLPTEAEWEYAARGGNKSKGYKYAGSNKIDDVAWHGESDIKVEETQVVAQKKPNELGIFDMSGNVFEWCLDWHDDSYYYESVETDPSGPRGGNWHVQRGGAFCSAGLCCVVSARMDERDSLSNDADYFNGFRLVYVP